MLRVLRQSRGFTKVLITAFDGHKRLLLFKVFASILGLDSISEYLLFAYFRLPSCPMGSC